MARERWLIDGWEITDGWARDVELRDGLYVTSAPVGPNGTVAGRTGDLWRAKTLGPGGFVLNVWVAGGNRAEVESNYDAMVRAVLRPHSLLTIDRYLADGTVRTCLAEGKSAITPNGIGSVGMRLAIEFNVPSGTWLGKTPSTVTGVAGAAVPKALALTGAMATATAMMENLAVTITGPITNPVVTDTTPGGSGTSFTYAGVVSATQTLTVDSGGWTMSGTGGLVPDPGALSYTGNRYLVVAHARPGDTPSIQITGTGTTTATNVSVAGPATFAA